MHWHGRHCNTDSNNNRRYQTINKPADNELFSETNDSKFILINKRMTYLARDPEESTENFLLACQAAQQIPQTNCATNPTTRQYKFHSSV